jgi:hypothetical protein
VGQTVNSFTAEYGMDYNVVDLELGYTYNPTGSMNLRFFGGLRHAEVDHRILATFYDPPPDTTRMTETNNLEGFGPRIGLESRYYLGGGFSLFAGGAASLMVSEINYSYFEEDWDPAYEVRANMNRKMGTQLVPVVDLDLGISWEYAIGQKGFLIVTAGYHYENWFNAYHQYRFVDDVVDSHGALNASDLAIHGPFLNLTATF